MIDKRSKIQTLTPASKEDFEAAYKQANYATNIYGWQTEAPAPGYYRCGGTIIYAHEPDESGVCGVVVQAGYVS